MKIGSGPATVSSDDPRFGLGTVFPALFKPGSGLPATVMMMGRHGRKDDLQDRRPARVRPVIFFEGKEGGILCISEDYKNV